MLDTRIKFRLPILPFNNALSNAVKLLFPSALPAVTKNFLGVGSISQTSVN
ncbi:hypothetical protein L9W92_08265 [Pelotomaculum terephthalicicum JT]|uniref:hypothetical protein n=1 Tax=Pelotomaculum terephthalicicum TaxID=206393 RepID=UPI001F036722|nr:hypothetical protein [Pelotomaculum terephthalicicum]MCG9968041.1 hypothetical protein [Pelotomaculum terephthalicicum JT]